MSDNAGPRDGAVSQLLLEAALDDDAPLRHVLQELRALGSVTPEPSAEIAALMSGRSGPLTADAAWTTHAAGVLGGAATLAAPDASNDAAPAAHQAAGPPVAPVDELAARRRAKRRIALTTLSVAVSLSAGGAVAVASDETIRKSFMELNQAVTSFITGSGATPAVNQAEEPAAPQPSVSTGLVPGSASIPADPAAVTQPTPGATQPVPAPPSDGHAVPDPAQPTMPGKPGEFRAPETVPGSVPGHIADGLSGPHVPAPADGVPLPGPLPAVPLP